MPETEPTTNRWRTRFWGALLVGQVILLAFALLDIARGTPDTYLNQHTRLAASSATGIFLALVYLLRRPAFQYAAMTGATATIVWHVLLSSG